MGKRFYLGGVNLSCDIFGLVFLCKYHRHIKILGYDTCNSNTGCLDGEDLIYLSIRKSALKFLSNFAKSLISI